MIEVFEPPLYFAWRLEHGMPYVVHFYIAERSRSYRAAVAGIKRVRAYFREQGFRRVLVNARVGDLGVQRVIEHHFRVKPYGQADEHKFYFVEV